MKSFRVSVYPHAHMNSTLNRESWHQQDKARRWLAENIPRARIARLSNDELLVALNPETASADIGPILDRVQQLAARDGSFAALLTVRLETLVNTYAGTGFPAMAVDRIALHVLKQLPYPGAERLARSCLKSSRKLRRRGAWYYYSRHELSHSARPLVVDQFRNLLQQTRWLSSSQDGVIRTFKYGGLAGHAPHVFGPLLELVASDSVVLAELGVVPTFNQLPTLRLKARALTTALTNDLEIDQLLLRKNIEAWIWGAGIGQTR